MMLKAASVYLICAVWLVYANTCIQTGTHVHACTCTLVLLASGKPEVGGESFHDGQSSGCKGKTGNRSGRMLRMCIPMGGV